ncbi:hypothetical protein [Actinoplanes sp. NBRC 101535]|uniref:hypothetical protein n=1 Tax=Actinoplanes sp. NBRC 101535 TaxID=3032196 RepID=UPI0024A12DCD|nr:hypothetical protein [Actinoplanes sp. NBRC 101535]GLY07468.1 hypothetical protein Acsp01_78470 [Actinoplanes sp. NBRC 101535]
MPQPDLPTGLPAGLPTGLPTGPFRGSDAVTAGLISRGALRGGRWVRLFPDVYACRATALTHRDWCTAALLVAPAGSAVGALSAAHLWGAGTRPPSDAGG